MCCSKFIKVNNNFNAEVAMTHLSLLGCKNIEVESKSEDFTIFHVEFLERFNSAIQHYVEQTPAFEWVE